MRRKPLPFIPKCRSAVKGSVLWGMMPYPVWYNYWRACCLLHQGWRVSQRSCVFRCRHCLL
jgi:hypothetical protein